MSWTPKTLTPPLPPGAQDVVNAISSATGAVSSALSAFSAALDAAKIFYNAGTDVFVLLLNTVITEAENLNNDIFNSGAFQLIVDPFSLPQARSLEDTIALALYADLSGEERTFTKDKYGIPYLTPAEAIAAAVRSLDDTGDLQRPVFSDSTHIAAFGLLITAPDLAPFLDLLEALLSVWNLDDLEFIFRRMKTIVNPTKKSVPVDWDSLQFNQVDCLAKIQDQNNKILALARGYLNVGDSIIPDMIDTIQRKVDVLNDSVLTFQAVIDAIIAIAGVPNVFFLNVPLDTGGTNRLKRELRDQNLESLQINKYTIMLLYVGGGILATGVDNVRKLLE